jgi:hypothetical protein
VATVPRVIAEKNSLAIIGLTVSVVGLFTLGILSPLGLAASIAGALRPPRGTAIAGILLGLVGTILLLVYTLPRYLPPVVREVGVGATANDMIVSRSAQDTYILLRGVADLLDERRPDNGDAPSPADGQANTAGRQDAWITGIRYALIDDKSFEVRSAGPDRLFDTADDLVVTRTR